MLVEIVARLWATKRFEPEKDTQIDLLALVAHGATSDSELTEGAKSVLRHAHTIIQNRPHGNIRMIGFGSFTGSSNPDVEKRTKGLTLPSSAVYVGNVFSTIEECVAIRTAWYESQFDFPATIVVVTDEAHSQRCRLVWNTFFPSSDIEIVAVPLIETVDRKSPMWPYRHAWTTLLFQALPFPFFWWLALGGQKRMLRFATKLHQPVVD